jgi:hypothetical protein
MELKALIQEMGRPERQLGVKSAEFHQAMLAGELDEFDALDVYRLEFIEWLALYKTWLSLNSKYWQLIARQPVTIHIKTALATQSQ